MNDAYEFQNRFPEEEEWEGGWKPKPKEPVRFSPKILAAQLAKPLPDYTRDRAAEAVRDSAGHFLPKPIKKSKPMKEPKEETPVSQAGKAPEGIQSTKDYRVFNLLPTNRPVDQRHVNKLMASIREKNLLNLNPIVVNGSYDVIDGQHRLEAARRLGVPIFFVQADSVTQDDIAGMNSNKKNWALMDYIHFYAEQGKEDYVSFTRFAAAHPDLPPATLLKLASAAGTLKASYKEGRIDISAIGVVDTVITLIPDYETYTPFAKSNRFLEALTFVVRSGLYDHEHMLKKLEQTGRLEPQAQVKGWIECLQRTYNWKMRDDSYVTFLKRI